MKGIETMGLDITAYKNVEFIEELADVEEYENKYDWQAKFDFVSRHQDFPDRLPPIRIQAVYKYEDNFGFRAGSYSGYNLWREQLSLMALGVMPEIVWKNASRYAGQPFFELIHFSDCEGTMGTDVCKKLLKDFQVFQARANQNDDPWFIEKYNDWLKAFEFAADNGYIDFH
jgi:hypothetical protein